MITVKEAAAQLKMSTRFVYRLCAEGLLEHFKLGGRIRIQDGAVACYLEQQKGGGRHEVNQPRRMPTLSCLKLKGQQ